MIAKVLADKWLVYFGMPLRIRSNRQPSSDEAVIAELCKMFRVHASGAPVKHHSNQVFADVHNILSDLLRRLGSEQKN